MKTAKTQIEKLKALVMDTINISGSSGFEEDSEAAPQYHEASRRRHHTGGSLHHSINAGDASHQYDAGNTPHGLSNSESAWW